MIDENEYDKLLEFTNGVIHEIMEIRKIIGDDDYNKILKEMLEKPNGKLI